jgi:type VII secretion protein EccB
MASSKDILEAQRYNRRRLISAFVAGTPEGREITARYPERPLIIGLVLSLVLVLVAVVLGRMSSTLPSGWENNTLVIVKGDGARYFTIDGVLRPVTNVTSAKLLVTSGTLKTSEVDASVLNGIPRGSTVGIVKAPDQTPSVASLKSGTWVSCSSDNGGPHTWVGAEPTGIQSAGVALVSDSNENTYLIADGRRYPMAADVVRPIKFALGLQTAPTSEVDASWLELFKPGSALKPLTLDGAGGPATNMPSGLQSAKIGSTIEVNDGSATTRYLVTGSGKITPLTDFAYRLYHNVPGAATDSSIVGKVSDVASLEMVTDVVKSDWPSQLGTAVSNDYRVCARLVESSTGSTTELTQLPRTSATTLTSGVSVSGGSGALVRTTSGGTLGAVSLITDGGTVSGVGGNYADTLTKLGYTESDVHVLAAPWVALVPPGAELSATAAWQTVKS